MEASSHPVHTLPFEGKLVPWKEHLLWGGDPVTLAPDHIFRDLGGEKRKRVVNSVILPEPHHEEKKLLVFYLRAYLASLFGQALWLSGT